MTIDRGRFVVYLTFTHQIYVWKRGPNIYSRQYSGPETTFGFNADDCDRAVHSMALSLILVWSFLSSGSCQLASPSWVFKKGEFLPSSCLCLIFVCYSVFFLFLPLSFRLLFYFSFGCQLRPTIF